MTPTLHTLARLLSPWRTICKLWSINRRLQRSNDRLAAMVFLACSKNVARDRRLRRCPTHGQQQPNAWGCPECVRELRQDLNDAQRQLATAREALQRVAFGGWFENSQFSVDHHARVVEGVADWVRSGMAGPLPLLPEYLAKREKVGGGERP